MKTLLKIVVIATLLWQFVLGVEEAVKYENEKAAHTGTAYTQMKTVPSE